MLVRQLLILSVVMMSVNGFCAEVKQKFATLYELQVTKTISRQLLDKYLDAIAEQLYVENENREVFKNEVFETWYADCKEAYAELNAQHYTESEVDQMIYYAESEVGKKIAEKQQTMNFQLMPVYQSIGVVSTKVAESLRNK